MKARESILCDGDKTELELRLGHRFGNGNLLATALTHSSWANEAGHLTGNQYRGEEPRRQAGADREGSGSL